MSSFLANGKAYGDAEAVTPSDSANASYAALYVGTKGHVAVVTEGGTSVTFYDAPDGCVIPIRTQKVLSTGTTASHIVGLK